MILFLTPTVWATLLVSVEIVAESTAPLSPQLQEQLQRVSALRQIELAELAAAAQVRKLQHELQVAQLQQQIRDLAAPVRQTSAKEEGDDPLQSARLVGVAQIQQQRHVWFTVAEQLVSLKVGEAHWLGLKVEHIGNRLRLQHGRYSRDFMLPKEW